MTAAARTAGVGEESGIDNPILNGPYDAPARHFELGSQGPTGKVLEGRRPSESFIPVPAPRKGKGKGGEQQALDLDVSGERIEKLNFLLRAAERIPDCRLADLDSIVRF